MISFDFKQFMDHYLDKNIQMSYLDQKESIKEKLYTSPMTDWLSQETSISKEELNHVKSVAQKIKSNSDILLVIGIGGSYLGAKAVIDALHPYFKKDDLEILFAGINLSSAYLNDLLQYITAKNITVNIISKSGTTLEPNITFDKIYDLMKEKYSLEELQERIIITTGYDHNNLHELALKNRFETFEIPTQIGGRFSVFTSVGLLPIAASGIDIDALLEGAFQGTDLFDDAYYYATIRQIMYESGRMVESYTIYEEKLYMFTEWLKQLFAETQGKKGKGILPISLVNTRDLHSLGQFIQEGNKILFETVLQVKNSPDIPIDKYNQTLNQINQLALVKVCEAHDHGNSPSNIISIEQLDAYHLGKLQYFFFLASAIGGYLLEVNPFDQPGVSEYKNRLAASLKQQ